MKPTPSTATPFPPLRLAHAPHRLLFFVGVSNLVLAMAWWAAVLAVQRWPALGGIADARVPAGWLHAFVMQYQMLPSFVFGFLLTTFPRWMGLPEFDRWRYVPVGLGVFGGQVATLLGAMGWPAGLVVGVFMTLAGWIAALVTLGPLLWREKGTTWHARSCFMALVLGLLGLLAWTAFLLGGSPLLAFASIKLGTFGVLLPIYLTVAHRMFPFFAANVVRGYTAWRPLWLLSAFWALCAVHLGLELVHAYGWLWLPDLGLSGLTAWLCARWWPRGAQPPILRVLFLGLAWLPVAFALYAGQSVAYLLTDVYPLGRAPAHALFVGFFGSVLIAMVTRVTQGHSGRTLELPAVARYAFIAIQAVTVVRIAAELVADSLLWQVVAALGWLFALLPWAVRLGRIYLTPRVDGKAG